MMMKSGLLFICYFEIYSLNMSGEIIESLVLKLATVFHKGWHCNNAICMSGGIFFLSRPGYLSHVCGD